MFPTALRIHIFCNYRNRTNFWKWALHLWSAPQVIPGQNLGKIVYHEHDIFTHTCLPYSYRNRSMFWKWVLYFWSVPNIVPWYKIWMSQALEFMPVAINLGPDSSIPTVIYRNLVIVISTPIIPPGCRLGEKFWPLKSRESSKIRADLGSHTMISIT